MTDADQLAAPATGGTETAAATAETSATATTETSSATAATTTQPAAATEKQPDATKAADTSKPAITAEQAAAKIAWPEDGFPDDWRERTLKSLSLEGDALKRAQEAAKRAASPAELLRSVLTGTQKISELTADIKDRVKIPGEKAKPEDVEAFRKAWGVPEAHDKYDLAALGEMTEVDKEIWNDALPVLHKANLSQAQINATAQVLKTAETVVAKRMEDRAKAVDIATQESLLLEYGSSKERDANIELANRYLGEVLGKHMDQAARTDLMNMKMADGTRLGSHIGFAKGIIEAARAWAPDALPEMGESGAGFDPQQKINEIIKLSHSQKPADKKEYQRLQPELQRLVASVNRRNAAGKK